MEIFPESKDNNDNGYKLPGGAFLDLLKLIIGKEG